MDRNAHTRDVAQVCVGIIVYYLFLPWPWPLPEDCFPDCHDHLDYRDYHPYSHPDDHQLITLTSTMPLLITWNVLMLVPVILHKIDSLTTGVVLMTMLTPVFCMARRYAHINRLTLYIHALDYPGLAIDHLRLRIRIVTDINSTIKAGLADADRNPDVGSEYRGA